eukprot:TRINITY_DN54022_c0_g1_i1.p1 TRINITY_DN54022_c0_g1~~TRINITY_DN54022_c0_g1_i1.p1  ORF type:complete len:699 (-),score=136.09 TRINITY_DN54022_c0_g1_i1:68-2164(-)
MWPLTLAAVWQLAAAISETASGNDAGHVDHHGEEVHSAGRWFRREALTGRQQRSDEAVPLGAAAPRDAPARRKAKHARIVAYTAPSSRAPALPAMDPYLAASFVDWREKHRRQQRSQGSDGAVNQLQANSPNVWNLENVASQFLGSTPFGSGSWPTQCKRSGAGTGALFGVSGSSCFHHLTDGVQGDGAGWRPSPLTYGGLRFAGVRFSSPKYIHGLRVAFSPPAAADAAKAAEQSTGSPVNYLIQTTTNKNADHVSPKKSWRSIGFFTRDDPTMLDYYFKLAVSLPIVSTAIRIVPDGVQDTIDELEVYGGAAMVAADLGDLEKFENIGSRKKGAVPFASGSLAAGCRKAGPGDGADFCEDEDRASSSCFCSINDGLFADSGKAWTPNANASATDGKRFVGIRFYNPSWIAGIGISRQGNWTQSCCKDNFGGTYEVQVATSPGASFDSEDAIWSTLGTMKRFNADPHYAKFSFPVSMAFTAVRVLVSDPAATIDELQVFGGLALRRASEDDFRGKFTNVASREMEAVPFGSGSGSGCEDRQAGEGANFSTGIRCFQNINDGMTGNPYAFVAGAGTVNGERFVGVRFRRLAKVVGLRLSSDDFHKDHVNYAECSGNFHGKHKIQVTAVADAASGIDSKNAWETVGEVTRETAGFVYYKLVKPIETRALRIVLDSTTTCLDELEVYGGLIGARLKKNIW